jgi:D-arabinose 1-dehydrogenase-like Zn-dependent alcohol dehydrogenase
MTNAHGGSRMLAGRLEISSRKFEVREVPVPEPGPGQVRLRVRAAGVCLSDVHLIDGSLTPPFLDGDEVTLGHEVAGEIDALGPDVPGPWEAGQRVTLQAGERCGACAECLRFRQCIAVRTRGVDYDGGWAEYALANHHTLVAIPDEMPFDQAAIVPDAVSTPWGAITGLGRAAVPGRPAGVWGVGGLGTHAVQLLRIVGAAPIVAVDPLPAARERALEFGADAAFDPAEPDLRDAVLALTGGLNVAYDMAGVGAVREQAVSCLGVGGRLVLVGLTPEPLKINDSIGLSFRGKQILGSYGGGPESIEQLITLARFGRLDLSSSISGTMPLADAAKAVAQLATKDTNAIRLILRP